MKQGTNKALKWLLGSLEATEHGASSRKLAAFSIIICVIICHVKWLASCSKNSDYSLLPAVLGIDFGFIAACLALTTYQQIKAKDSGPNNPPDQPPVTEQKG